MSSTQMNSFFKLYALFRSLSAGKVSIMAYQNSTYFYKFNLWVSTISFFLLWIAFLLAENGAAYFWLAMCMGLVWIFSLRSIHTKFFSQFEVNPFFLKLYWREHQAIRYILFSEKVSAYPGQLDLDSALDHLNIEIDTSSKPLSLPPSIQLLSALFFAVVSSQAGDWGAEFAATVLMATGLYIVFYLSFGRLIKTRVDHLKEFKRFLLWKKNETSAE